MAFAALLELECVRVDWEIRFDYFAIESRELWGRPMERAEAWAMVVDSFHGFS